MRRKNIKKMGYVFLTCVSLQAFAEEVKEINVTVTTKEKTAAGIGYTVDGKDIGGPGNSYVGKGPANKKYIFGYRKDFAHGEDVRCGALTLTHSSTITLVIEGGKCRVVSKSTGVNPEETSS